MENKQIEAERCSHICGERGKKLSYLKLFNSALSPPGCNMSKLRVMLCVMHFYGVELEKYRKAKRESESETEEESDR